MYALIFAALYSLESAYHPRGWTLDSAIRRRISWWRLIAEPGGTTAIPAPANFAPSLTRTTKNQPERRAA
jgi:hypothetical protein